MKKTLLYLLFPYLLLGCSFKILRPTYFNDQLIPTNNTIELNTVANRDFAILIFNSSKEDVPLKFTTKDNSLSKILYKKDTIRMVANINNGIIVSNEGEKDAIFSIRISNIRGGVIHKVYQNKK